MIKQTITVALATIILAAIGVFLSIICIGLGAL